jgi:cell division protein FtsZ
MTINLQLPKKPYLKPSITVFGVGGAGGNAVNNMISANLEGINFVVANTDAQALEHSLSEQHIQLGESITQGLGAGSYPEVGRASAEESTEEVLDHLQGSNMVFVTAGMGGGTGTGAAPVVARLAREQGILTVAVVTKPFHFEGSHRMRVAEQGIEELQKYVDTLIIIPNQNLFRVADKSTTFKDAFKMADDVLRQGVQGITDLMVMPGLINLDFADIRSVMSEMGKAMMGTGQAQGDGRAIQAAEAAISNPLLDNVSMKGAKGVLINITGGADLTLFEVDEAANRIRDEVDPDANIIFGSTFDEALEGSIRVSVVATGIEGEANFQHKPAQKITASAPARRPEPQPVMAQEAEEESYEEVPQVVPNIRLKSARPANEGFTPLATSVREIIKGAAKDEYDVGEDIFIPPDAVVPEEEPVAITRRAASPARQEMVEEAEPAVRAEVRTRLKVAPAPQAAAETHTAEEAHARKGRGFPFFGFGSGKKEEGHESERELEKVATSSVSVSEKSRDKDLFGRDDLDIPAYLRRNKTLN